MMDSEWLRSLDKNIGQPVCFLFSLLNFFKRKNRDIQVKNILVLELFEMGAAVMAYPSIRCLQKNYPQANIYCLCTDSVKEAWEVLNIVPGDHILSVESKDLFRFGRSLLKRIVQLRKIKIDLLIDLGLFMRIPSMIAFMIGAKLTSGFYRYDMEGLYRGITTITPWLSTRTPISPKTSWRSQWQPSIKKTTIPISNAALIFGITNFPITDPTATSAP